MQETIVLKFVFQYFNEHCRINYTTNINTNVNKTSTLADFNIILTFH